MSKTKKITIFSLLGAFAIVLVLGSIFDLSISKALADLTAGEYYSQTLLIAPKAWVSTKATTLPSAL